MSRLIRLHVGNVSGKLDGETINERFAKYGEVIEGIELHQKPTLDTKFGYITMNLSQSQLSKLKTVYHGIMFKGSKMTINIARPKYTEWLQKDHERPDPRLTKDQLKRMYSRSARTIDEIQGRERKTRRKGTRRLTVRMIKRDGRKVEVRCSRKKLWGYKKDKPLDLLVWSYSHGQWKDGNGDVIETTDLKGLLSQEDGDDDDEEKERNLQILNDLFSGEGRDRLERVELFDDDNEGQNEPAPVIFDNDYDEETTNNDTATNDKNNNGEEKQDLKELFGANSSSGGFSLAPLLDEDDINMENAFDDEPEIPLAQKKPQSEPAVQDSADTSMAPIAAKHYLFFAHQDSPFLSTQSRLASLKTQDAFALSAWEDEFWKTRGEWNRQFQRRRRDVLRRRKTRSM